MSCSYLRKVNAVLFFVFFILLTQTLSYGEVKRVVIIKVDGLPNDAVERYVRERDPRTGKSYLPWFERVFFNNGTRLENFYVRGMSLSASSWSLLDTGQHLQIKGNVEYDRFTLHAYDYLNFIPFYINYSLSRRVDMPGAEVLDEVGVPLLGDAYPYGERRMGFQLYQRGVRWTTLQRGLQNRITTRTPRELLDEWTTGFETRNIIDDQLVRELISKLKDTRIRYLDYYSPEYDHVAHGNRDPRVQLQALQEIDAIVGRVWTGVERSPLASETALALVSDHGINTDARSYSQGYNLVKLLTSAVGGAHHVVTKRRLMQEYALKGIYPLTPLFTTTAPDSFYLKNRSEDYPTALLDFDGNERTSIHLRDSDLNLLQIVFQQLQKNNLSPALQRAATNAFFATIERRRAEWERTLKELREELTALRGKIERDRLLFDSQPKEWTQADRDAGRDQDARRIFARMDAARSAEQRYTEYARTLANLLSLSRENFDPSRLKVEDFLSRRAMGESNTIYKLQNYVAGLAPGGLALTSDGALDARRSFTRVDYFTLLHDVRMRNNVQAGVGSRPVDFVAVRVPREALTEALDESLLPGEDAIWLNGGRERQALVLARRDEAGKGLRLRYLPVAGLKQDESGRVSFERVEWREEFPLKMWEDENIKVPEGDRAAWLNAWHTDVEWTRALHKGKYSNGFVGLHELFGRHQTQALDPSQPGLTENEALLRRFTLRQRRLVEPDLTILANDHWNFDVKGFNPGGNHGSFFRISTHSVLMFAGGELTGIPRAAVVQEAYDSLSFVPTVLTLTNQLVDGRPSAALSARGFREFPGRIIKELFVDTKRGAPKAESSTDVPQR
ncbi:MAG: alkaline phosphatase family protein [Pyrinomonadaceae bacterium]|nr:alkaline phosphatase family protein [Pyrinomonadaceae bacterium]